MLLPIKAIISLILVQSLGMGIMLFAPTPEYMMMYILLVQTCNVIMSIDRIIASVKAILEELTHIKHAEHPEAHYMHLGSAIFMLLFMVLAFVTGWVIFFYTYNRGIVEMEMLRAGEEARFLEFNG